MSRTRLETVVSLAEIVTALAVVASLLYAASEFRRSQTLTSTDVETLLYQRMLERDRLLIENPELAELQITAARRPEALSPAQMARFLAYEHVFYDSWELAWSAGRDGVLGEAAWNDWNGWFVAEARRRPRAGWTGNRRNHSDGFVRYVEDRLGEPAPAAGGR